MKTTFLAFAVLLTACSQSEGGTGTDTSDDLPQCSWPASLDTPADGGPWGWHVARTLLECQAGSDTALGLSNDLTTISDPPPGVTLTGCVDQCAADEYAVSAGGPPQETADGGFADPAEPNLPAACRVLDPTPAGLYFACCPCE